MSKEEQIKDEVEDVANEADQLTENKKDSAPKKKIGRKKTDKKDEEITALKEQLMRVQAEFENYKRRSKSDLEDMAKFGSENMVLAVLPVLDNFQRALSVKPTSETLESFYQGMDLIEKQLLEALKSNGLETIEALGEAFDPVYHNGVMNEPVTDEKLVGTVTGELQTGYLLNKKVVRPSMVKIGIKN